MSVRSFARSLLAGAALAALAAAAPTYAQTGVAAPQVAQAAQNEEDAKLDRLLESFYQQTLDQNPNLRSRLGLPGDHSKWTPVTDEFERRQARIAAANLDRMRREIDESKLSPRARINYRLFAYTQQTQVEQAAFEGKTPNLTLINSPAVQMPTLLLNFHKIGSVKDAEDYIARLEAMPQQLADVLVGAEERKARGVVAPAFNFGPILASAGAVIKGKPFDQGPAPAPLLADFTTKVEKLDVPAAEKARLVAAAEQALTGKVGPAYRDFLTRVEALGKGVTANDGAWSLPDGADLYKARIKLYTTLPMEPEAIHKLGLKEVERIQGEIRKIMKQTGFKGDLQAFFTFLREDPQFVLPSTEEGRKTYITRATQVIDEMRGKLDAYFGVKPKSELQVKAVEAYREASAHGAFYEAPSLDGTRPATYYANMKDMKDLPLYELQTLAYHEGIPGHHMQIAIATEQTDVPKFRRFYNNSAYAEGWALYSEKLAKEMGVITDPYSDVGRLNAELFRAVRLVVDTGIHHKRWSREKALAYMNDNTANASGDNAREVERYINWPGQALAYKIGMLKIEELRAMAQKELGDRFDIRAFHDTILSQGAVPLTILEDMIKAHVAQAKAGKA
ncbi:MAG TPA: DUF885 domain-containing protein [Azospirillaceae bacterium]|nr:DUF885 domain-containing protein [Azospirillaceae bacterium]